MFVYRYSQLSITRPIPELVTAEELQKLKDEIRNPVVPEGGQAPPPPQVGLTELFPSAYRPANCTKQTDAEMDQLLRQKIHQLKSELYLKTQEAVMARWVFEEQIKRAYFHVKPLDEAQLTNWRKYLDFEEGAGDPTRIYHLYERCLVACVSPTLLWFRRTERKRRLIQWLLGFLRGILVAVRALRNDKQSGCPRHLPQGG